MSKQRLLFITTGGTIASVRTAQGLKPVLTSEELLAHLPELQQLCCPETLNLCSIDSTDLFLILYASARIGAGYPILTDGTLSDWEIESMDVNGDGTIAADDAYAVLLYCGLESVGKHPTSLDDFDWENNTIYTG